MIETKETRAEFEKRREKARAAMKSALRGELPFSDETVTLGSKLPEATPEHMHSEHGLVIENKACPICEERKRKSRERVKRYREKKK